MKYTLTVTLIFLSSQIFSQSFRVNFSEITNKEYHGCIVSQPVLLRGSSLNDTLVAEDFRFKILGTFKSLDSFTLMRSIPDSIFYLVNDQTGWFDQLLGFPVFSTTMKEFACFGSFFGRSTIRLYEIRDQKLNKKFEDTFYKTATELCCVTDSSFYVKDINNRYWKYELHQEQ